MFLLLKYFRAYQWGPKLLSLMSDSQEKLAFQTTTMLLGDNWHRIIPQIDVEEFALDDVSAIPSLKKQANDVNLSDTIQWIRNHFH
jgi:hypothetical protein